MRHVDFSPFYRSTIGFDRLFQLLDTAGTPDDQTQGYPPYNIERLAENDYRLTMAVAGFAADEVKIEMKEQTLAIRAEKKPDEAPREYLHRGIAARSFERRFHLADHIEVKGADLQNGLLHIDLVRNVPERMKPRQIAIGSGAGPQVRQIEANAA